MICLLIDVDGGSREIVLPADPAQRAALVDGLLGAAWNVRVAIARGLGLWAGCGVVRLACDGRSTGRPRR
ncbi:hypothetical protein [Herbidospora sp. NBRC 101105]|uniref:hypothetical protein n=1 Tax=Herbidospora sp. NBRC 101105 TaxID=3032195 RepID=UPI0024A5CDF8|nr:hypothetical protein [Herbidospora sp. NBRC 101105]GLX92938.1 hypothetical protein Hesp01_08880 [Herbidospora sp. NBRC 101105]